MLCSVCMQLAPCGCDMQHLYRVAWCRHAALRCSLYMQYLHATCYMQHLCTVFTHSAYATALAGEKRGGFQPRSVHGVRGAGRDARPCKVPAGRWVSSAMSPGCSLSPAQQPRGDLGGSVTVAGGWGEAGQGAAGEVNAVISRGRGSPTDKASLARWGDSSAACRGHKGGSPGSSWSQGRG